ncbi:MAG TPA: 1-(5-phosphoribosyl)-5-[(5-phosphoribosylamino)methylideneamino]imidazole-4-carboxamide isomerase [Chloroflexota bacterium]
MGFEVIPAIDLRAGRCVRLTQGDFDRETRWSDDPVATAQRWTDAGAQVIHIVDLDGAADGEPKHLEVLRALRQATSATLQFGGGLRNDESVEAALEAGADRVVVGTALVTQPDWVASLCARHGDKIIAGLDARQGRVATAGWLETTTVSVQQLIERANEIGLRRGHFTDIERDGTLSGPNVNALAEVIRVAKFEVVASGGIAQLEDLEAVRAVGAAGAIIGQALYTGQIDLRQALTRMVVA